jgi:CelD/BcsL family acetyltransferase involved in cellulose biosynthesis
LKRTSFGLGGGALWGNCVRVDVIDVNAMSEELAGRWRALQSLTPDFGSPLVGPDFAKLVARNRPDAKVAIGYEGGKPIAFFAFHPARNGYVRGIGSPFCDYQAIVTDPDANIVGEAFLRAAGISSIVFSSLMDPHNQFNKAPLHVVESHRIDCKGNGPAFFEVIRGNNPKWAKNLRRLGHKMERELGPVRMVGNDTSRATFDAMMAIKVAQYHHTGVTNVLRPAWVVNMMRELFELGDPDFGGCLISLYAGEKFVAGHFGVRQGDWYHPWIASSCPKSHAYSPGIVFLGEAIRKSQDFGIRVIDLSSGSDHYKSQFCRTPILTHSGVIGDKPHTAPDQGRGPLALIKRRFDMISALEPDLMGQVIAIGSAIGAVPKRIASRRAQNEHA